MEKGIQSGIQNRPSERPLLPKGRLLVPAGASPRRPFFGHRFLHAFWSPFGTVSVKVRPFWLHLGSCWAHFGHKTSHVALETPHVHRATLHFGRSWLNFV